ncbi:MAG TPA: peptidoglycan DD-metalloendopeptidase family protein [Fimbriimonadales bacterium]|nr:peptidoglycan DD-metalloendopeptidase family protein [Fimbriimonadales bacterium]
MRGKLIFVLAMVLAVFAFAQKPSKKTLLNKQKSTRSQANALRKEIKQTTRKISYVMSDIERADNLLEDARSRLKHTEIALNDAQAEQDRAAEALNDATEKLDGQKEVVGKRIRAVYMTENESSVGAFFGTRSFTDSQDESFVARKIAEQDQEMIAKLREFREEVNRRKAVKDSLVRRIGGLMAARRAEKATLDNRMRFKKGLLGELKENREDAQDELDELEKESAVIEAELRRYYAVKSNVPVYRGSYRMPVNGRITSTFGRRVHPITHAVRMHTGLDIAAPMGTPIHACGDGRVIFAGRRGGYGNCIIIDHGGGKASLYGHCSKLYVGVGKEVNKGDVIAAVGSTGLSTGPHCHWEIRINGKPVPPR